MPKEYILKSCPFCGGSVKPIPGTITPIPMIHCYSCGATVSFNGKERLDKTIKAWNRRTYESEN